MEDAAEMKSEVKVEADAVVSGNSGEGSSSHCAGVILNNMEDAAEMKNEAKEDAAEMKNEVKEDAAEMKNEVKVEADVVVNGNSGGGSSSHCAGINLNSMEDAAEMKNEVKVEADAVVNGNSGEGFSSHCTGINLNNMEDAAEMKNEVKVEADVVVNGNSGEGSSSHCAGIVSDNSASSDHRQIMSENAPFIIEKVSKIRTIRIFGNDIHVSETTSVAQLCDDDHHSDKFTRVLKKLAEETGEAPVFLFDKMLTETDVDSSKNRLFIPGKAAKRLMGCLRDGERAAVDSSIKQGLEISATDAEGRLYDELHIKRWDSLGVVVVKGSDWSKMVRDNAATDGSWSWKVHVWSYRNPEDANRLGLAVDFEKKIKVQGGSTRRPKRARKDPSGSGGDGAPSDQPVDHMQINSDFPHAS